MTAAASLLMVLAVTALAPRAAHAANTCNAFLSIDYPSGPDFALPGNVYRVGLEIGTGSITGGTQMQINRVRFELDCSSAGSLGIPCTDDGSLIEYEGDGTITTTCPGIVFTTGHGVSDSPNEVVFTPNTAILIAANTPAFCRVEFDVKVLSITDPDASPTQIEEVAGYQASTLDAQCNNGLQSSSSQSGSINVCPTCTDTECSTAACNQTTGMCDFTPKASSLPCADTDANACTTAGCDGQGTCNQSHIMCVTTTTTSTTTSTSSSTTSTTLVCIPMPEDCSNMIDDDCDNLVDCLDPDCPPNGMPCPIAKKDPTDIRFAPGMDRLRSKAVLEPPDGAPVDLSSVNVGILLTNPNGTLYRVEIPGSLLTPPDGNVRRFRNLAARTDPNGGLYEMKVKRQRGGNGYSVSTISYADLSGATDPQMRVQFYLGDQVFITIDTPWKLIGSPQKPIGWRAPKDH
jgi:hypothetical protein